MPCLDDNICFWTRGTKRCYLNEEMEKKKDSSPTRTFLSGIQQRQIPFSSQLLARKHETFLEKLTMRTFSRKFRIAPQGSFRTKSPFHL